VIINYDIHLLYFGYQCSLGAPP